MENIDMFTDWDGYNARKYAEAQAQQALFAAGPGAVWDAITKPIVDDWANNPGHALGGSVVTVGAFAIPGGGVLKGVRGVKAAEEAVSTAAKAADNLLPGLPASAPKPLGLGSTGRTAPQNLTEQLAMTEVRSAPGGRVLSKVTMTDPRWPASTAGSRCSRSSTA
ncbi:hypothetical protein BKA04_000754 [Cryobacterium mesophilum]|uniref:hypothetical protein n=1 Tax=Terrimesophilobacter mesophilus TaxID=433647 RepID=UPI001425587D|nr:hypothetical protein [Terrimesophilobacter mesophilus]MBB5632531.1 hypothetical protein [Terrimesophilobacter mesophilus]